MNSFTTFFGDGEYQFRLTPTVIKELETKCGVGIAMIGNRIFAKAFAHADIIETLRLALIGGGTAPKRAAELIAAYVADRPLAETYPLAAKIFEKFWCGDPEQVDSGAEQ
jgi:hypothetical protein